MPFQVCSKAKSRWNIGQLNRAEGSVRVPAAKRADFYVEIVGNRFFRVGPKRLRFTKAAVEAFVFPGIDREVLALEVVIAAGKLISTALRTITDRLPVLSHLSYRLFMCRRNVILLRLLRAT